MKRLAIVLSVLVSLLTFTGASAHPHADVRHELERGAGVENTEQRWAERKTQQQFAKHRRHADAVADLRGDLGPEQDAGERQQHVECFVHKGSRVCVPGVG